jgi:hypothetical protein
MKGPQTKHTAHPIFLYHNLKVSNKNDLIGMAARVLFATSCNSHEPGAVDILAAVDELRETGAMAKVAEEIVLDLFNNSRKTSRAQCSGQQWHHV